MTSFMTFSGELTARGKYCVSCVEAILQEGFMCWMEGRDYCLYCGRQLTRRDADAYQIDNDHMDPQNLGGDDTPENCVRVCRRCNQRKHDTPFARWLEKLQEPWKSKARQVYIEKHGRTPEEFKPIEIPPPIEIRIDREELLKIVREAMQRNGMDTLPPDA